MSRLLMKRRNTIRIRNPPGYRISRALSTFRNTRSMAFYLRVRNRATETRARARSLVGIVIKRESSTKSRIRVPFRIIISERRRGKGEGLEKFNGEKKHPVIACAVSLRKYARKLSKKKQNCFEVRGTLIL